MTIPRATTTNGPRVIPAPRPTKADLIAAKKKTVEDLIAPRLTVLFCGINPGLYTAAIGHHFGRPGIASGRRSMPAASRRAARPEQKHELLKLGYGITNLVPAPRPAPMNSPQRN